AQYCKNYEKANSKLMECLKRKEVATSLETASRMPASNLPDLQGYIIQPVQRLPRINLLLQDFLKKTPVTHPDHKNLTSCLMKIAQTIELVNESIKEAEKAFEFWQKHPQLISPVMEAHRQPIRKGDLMV